MEEEKLPASLQSPRLGGVSKGSRLRGGDACGKAIVKILVMTPGWGTALSLLTVWMIPSHWCSIKSTGVRPHGCGRLFTSYAGETLRYECRKAAPCSPLSMVDLAGDLPRREGRLRGKEPGSARSEDTSSTVSQGNGGYFCNQSEADYRRDHTGGARRSHSMCGDMSFCSFNRYK